MDAHQHILIIDDDFDVLAVTRYALETEGYIVSTAADGKTGLALVKSDAPDVVVLDLMMPGMDGFQVLDTIRQGSNLPVIMATTKYEALTASAISSLGADGYIKKPYATGELVSRIRALLRRINHAFPTSASSAPSSTIQTHHTQSQDCPS